MCFIDAQRITISCINQLGMSVGWIIDTDVGVLNMKYCLVQYVVSRQSITMHIFLKYSNFMSYVFILLIYALLTCHVFKWTKDFICELLADQRELLLIALQNMWNMHVSLIHSIWYFLVLQCASDKGNVNGFVMW